MSMLIAIDGPAASGKGTLGKRLAAHYGLAHLDTGLLYRATARALLDAGQALDDVIAATSAAAGLDISQLDEARLRGREMGEAASVVAVIPGVRSALLGLQRRIAHAPEGAVLDGRDIGTVVCPDANVKLFVTASAQERARRRHNELTKQGETTDYDAVLADIHRRDARDSTRETAPLKPADDARVLDTTGLDAEGAFAAAVALVDAKR